MTVDFLAPSIIKRIRPLSGLCVAGFLGIALIFPRLGEQHLWQDEAQTALISRTILTQGAPRGTDGLNSFSQEDGAEYGKDAVWLWHPWLSFYAVALSFKMLGTSTWAARLPSALAGVALLMLLFHLVNKRWKSQRLALLATLLCATNIQVLLISRQCRFYAIGMLLSLWASDLYFDFLDRRPRATVLLPVVLILLFHTFHFFFAVLVLTLVVHGILVVRQERSRFAALMITVTLFILPWLGWLKQFSTHFAWSPAGRGMLDAGLAAARFGYFSTHMIRYGVTWASLLAGAWLLLRIWRGHKTPLSLDRASSHRELLFYGLYTLLLLTTASILASSSFLRYLSPAWAPLSIIAAVMIDRCFHHHKGLGLSLFFVAFLSRPFAPYLGELRHGAQGTVDALVRFFQENGKEGESVLINYEDMPLKFYTPLRVYGGLTGEDLAPAAQADWIVLLQHRYVMSERGERVPRFIEGKINREEYQEIETEYTDSMLQNREEPGPHLFRSPSGPPYLTIYKRRAVR